MLFQTFVSRILQNRIDDGEVKSALMNVINPLLRPLSTLQSNYLVYTSSSHVESLSTEIPELIQTKRVEAALITNSLNMLTIGLTFPPFAVMVYFDTFLEFTFLRGSIGFFMNNLEKLDNIQEYEFFKRLLARDLKAFSNSLQEWEILVFIVLFSAMYYFLLLFDTLWSSVRPNNGSKYGCIPELIVIAFACILSFVMWRKFKDKSVDQK